MLEKKLENKYNFYIAFRTLKLHDITMNIHE